MSHTKQRIKRIFDKSLENVRQGKRPNVSGLMRIENYSPSASKALKVTKTKVWQNLLNAIDDQVILNKFYEILESDDKRSSLAAGIELLKLKDRYPANKMKVSQYENEL